MYMKVIYGKLTQLEAKVSRPNYRPNLIVHDKVSLFPAEPESSLVLCIELTFLHSF